MRMEHRSSITNDRTNTVTTRKIAGKIPTTIQQYNNHPYLCTYTIFLKLYFTCFMSMNLQAPFEIACNRLHYGHRYY